jgi:ATP-dependent protease ClpP protease subunit
MSATEAKEFGLVDKVLERIPDEAIRTRSSE